MEMDALKRLCPKLSDVEAELLKAFDSVRDQIHEISNKVYVRDGNGNFSYILAVKDFK